MGLVGALSGGCIRRRNSMVHGCETDRLASSSIFFSYIAKQKKQNEM